ncbi:MAG TPA: hypothetical protein VN873_04715 [Candidatus Angelobacter sp.]|nr:hypothetical protein [Candidatus Angelobacter sp.]
MNESFSFPPQDGPTAFSSIRTPTSYSNVFGNWQAIAQICRALGGLRGGNRMVADLLSVLKNTGFTVLPNPHPFKIYSIPPALRPTSDPATDWLKFRIRAGMVGDMDVNGTDEQNPPDSPDIPLDDLSDEILATAGLDQFFFWIELSSPGGVNTATIKSGDPNTNGWDDYPDTDGRFILIGWIDTTDTTNKQVKVRQIQRTDIQMGVDISICSGGSSSIAEVPCYRFDPPPGS